MQINLPVFFSFLCTKSRHFSIPLLELWVIDDRSIMKSKVFVKGNSLVKSPITKFFLIFGNLFFKFLIIVSLPSIPKYSVFSDKKNGILAPAPQPNSKTRIFVFVGCFCVCVVLLCLCCSTLLYVCYLFVYFMFFVVVF